VGSTRRVQKRTPGKEGDRQLSSYCLDDTTHGTLVQAKRGRIVGESCAEINRSSIGHARLGTSVRDAMS